MSSILKQMTWFSETRAGQVLHWPSFRVSRFKDRLVHVIWTCLPRQRRILSDTQQSMACLQSHTLGSIELHYVYNNEGNYARFQCTEDMHPYETTPPDTGLHAFRALKIVTQGDLDSPFRTHRSPARVCAGEFADRSGHQCLFLDHEHLIEQSLLGYHQEAMVAQRIANLPRELPGSLSPDEGPESLRSLCCGLAKNKKNYQ
ncbi:hypothetical protein PoB_001279500 [Plakobranchus ocellatus]|uniref:Uncharacterized protein n=1 Tax=Plakobranchus ocellatus TaxID=259542 RepID=A0AAV3YV27_9GAST|nr:hypothetical protein PoB_001279500 [Plakobranchus ocellatus]